MKRYMLSFSFMMILVGMGLIALLGRREDAVTIINSQGTMVESEKIHYQKDGVEAYYPKIISGGTSEERSVWNQIIEDDFNQILNIYSFRPYPNKEDGQNEVPTVLKIDYELKSQGGQFYSILYKARYSSPYVAHPTELVYTTNIDLIHNKRLSLKDLLGLNEEFVNEFREWSLVTDETLNKEVKDAIEVYRKEMTNQDLLQGFEKADVIGSTNIWGVFSYITPNGIGISISVPPYLGDHLEFEHSMKLRHQSNHSKLVAL